MANFILASRIFLRKLMNGCNMSKGYKKFTTKHGQKRPENPLEEAPVKDVFDTISEKQNAKGIEDFFEPTKNY